MQLPHELSEALKDAELFNFTVLSTAHVPTEELDIFSKKGVAAAAGFFFACHNLSLLCLSLILCLSFLQQLLIRNLVFWYMNRSLRLNESLNLLQSISSSVSGEEGANTDERKMLPCLESFHTLLTSTLLPIVDDPIPAKLAHSVATTLLPVTDDPTSRKFAHPVVAGS